MELSTVLTVAGFVLQTLIVPALGYIVSIDRRVSRIEGACGVCKDK